MTRVLIYSDGAIDIDDRSTGYRVVQKTNQTELINASGALVDLPEKHYSLHQDLPTNGEAGRRRFVSDLLAWWDNRLDA